MKTILLVLMLLCWTTPGQADQVDNTVLRLASTLQDMGYSPDVLIVEQGAARFAVLAIVHERYGVLYINPRTGGITQSVAQWGRIVEVIKVKEAP